MHEPRDLYIAQFLAGSLPEPGGATSAVAWQRAFARENYTWSATSTFAWPLELIWTRRGDAARLPEVEPRLSDSLTRIMQSRTFLAVHMSRLVNIGNSRNIALTEPQRYAELAAAVLVANGLRERIHDTAARLADAYQGVPAANVSRVRSLTESTITLRKLAIASGLHPAVKSGADYLADPLVRAGSLLYDQTVTQSRLTEVRDSLAHCKNFDFDGLTMRLLYDQTMVLDLSFGCMTWLLLGASHGEACPEYRPA